MTKKNDINELKRNLFNALSKYWETISSDYGKTFYRKDTDEFGFKMNFTVIGKLNEEDVDRDFTKVVVNNYLTNDFAEYVISNVQTFKFKNEDLELKYGEYYTVIKIIIRNITK